MRREGRRCGGEQEQLQPNPLRCAIYTRKSTEEGLTQEFNTLEAQRESAEAYVRSQAHAGWSALAERYDDGGYTGANLERWKLIKPGATALRGLITSISRATVSSFLTRESLVSRRSVVPRLRAWPVCRFGCSGPLPVISSACSL